MTLAPLARLAWGLTAWGLLFLASPGILTVDGIAPLAPLALVPWGIAAIRPGKKALLVEWIAASVGISAICWWTTLVWIGTLLAVALVPAFYMAFAGVLLRRIARHFPLALALPAAWVGMETLRCWVEPPLGFGWLRLGHSFHHIDWIAGSARVWGVGGLSWMAAALAGGLVDLYRRGTREAAGTTAGGQALRGWIAGALALGPLALAPVLGLATSAPPLVPGPRLLLVQPSFEQHRKMESQSASELFAEMADLTREGVHSAPERAGRPKVDLVCWGESLFPWPIADGLLATAWASAKPPSWARFPGSLEDIRSMERGEAEIVRGRLFEQRVIPAGASFVSGAELFLLHRDEIRRTTAAVLWGPDGKRAGWSAKRHLVPGGETMHGLERWGWVRKAAFALAGYVPDLVPGERTEVLEVPVQGARPVRLGLSICFDNTFDDPYTEPLRRGALDAHLVLSNEAWYEETGEYDQMLAFSRLAAIETGRALARVTNSGISIAFGADGQELARLRVGEKDRMVRGCLVVDLPVPAPGHERDLTPFVRWERWLRGLYLLVPIVLLALCRRRAVTAR